MANNNFAPDRRLVLLSAFALGGCGSLGLGPTDTQDSIYLLTPAAARQTPQSAPVNWALALDIPDAPDSLDSRRIALVKADGTMDYYAKAVWPDRLTLLVQTALLAAFQDSGRVPLAARTQDALHADYELTSEIRDFAAHYNAGDGGKPAGVPSVTVTVLAQMTTAHGRKIVADITATDTVPAAANSTGAVVQAMGNALETVAARIVAWTLALPLQAPGPGPSPAP